jgi:parallel beta-helix repeat protein
MNRLFTIPAGIFLVTLASILPGRAHAGCIGQTTATDFVCGMTITESCVMNEDLITTEQTCFEVGADDIVIDGNGHSITGPWVYGGPDGGKGVNLMVHENVTIRDLTINAFYWGIRIYYGTAVTIQDNSVDDVYFGIELETTTTDSTVENNSVADCIICIKLNHGATGNTFTGNTVSGAKYGVRI